MPDPPEIQPRSLLNTYIQRYVLIGGRIVLATLIVGGASGYVGGRAWGRIEKSLPGQEVSPSPGPTGSVEPTQAASAPTPEPEPKPKPKPKPDIETREVLHGTYVGSSGVAEGLADIRVTVEDGRLTGNAEFKSGSKEYMGYKGAGTVKIRGKVSSSGKIDARVSGEVPIWREGEESHQTVVVEGDFTGTITGGTAKTHYDVYAADMPFKGSPTLHRQ